MHHITYVRNAENEGWMRVCISHKANGMCKVLWVYLMQLELEDTCKISTYRLDAEAEEST